jgi:hypothetical protein
MLRGLGCNLVRAEATAWLLNGRENYIVLACGVAGAKEDLLSVIVG